MRNAISKILIFLGIALILGAAGLTAYNVWDANRADRASREVAEQLEALLAETEQETAPAGTSAVAGDTPLYEEYPDMKMPTKTIDGYRYVGILEIPKLKLKLPVMEEWDYTRLKIAPCRYIGSVYMHNMVIAGHNYRKHFSMLKWEDPGLEIIFKDMAGHTFRYTLAWTETIQPKNVEDMIEKDVDSWDMTLFTCTTGGGSRHAMRCVLTDE